MATVTLSDIRTARGRIADKVVRTPTILSPTLSEQLGVPVHLKLEHRQTTGSFKLRGASNAVASLSAEEKARGVVASSTGNHGRALAHAAKLEGMRAVICMSRLVPQNKLDEIRRLGADVRIVGNSQDEAQQEVERLVAQEGLVDAATLRPSRIIGRARQLGLEMIEQVPDAALVLAQLSGGGPLPPALLQPSRASVPEQKSLAFRCARGGDEGQPRCRPTG